MSAGDGFQAQIAEDAEKWSKSGRRTFFFFFFSPKRGTHGLIKRTAHTLTIFGLCEQ